MIGFFQCESASACSRLLLAIAARSDLHHIAAERNVVAGSDDR